MSIFAQQQRVIAADLAERADQCLTRVQLYTDNDKAIVYTVNSLIPIAAFISGVQAQIISFTLPFPHSLRGRVANIFAFIGLLLDIIGTFLGVVHALRLQRRIKDNAAVLTMIQALKKDLDGIEEPAAGEGTDAKTRKKLANMNDLFATIMQSYSRKVSIRFDPLNTSSLLSVHEESSKPETSIITFGVMPLVAMGCGVLCLVIATVLLSAEALANEVWIACVVVLVAVIAMSSIPFSYHSRPTWHGIGKLRPTSRKTREVESWDKVVFGDAAVDGIVSVVSG